MKKYFLFFCLMLSLASLATAQEINVEAGADAISAALVDASEGAVLILSTDGGVYTESADVTVVPDVTIKAADGLAAKPIWTTSGNNNIILEGEHLSLEGIIFEGLSNSDSAESAVVNNAWYENVLKVNDCEFRNFKGAAIFKEADNQEIISFDSVFVSHSLFHDCESGIYLGGDHPSGSGQHSDNIPGTYYLSVENCTFYNLTELAIKLEAYIPSGEPVLVSVDHVTVNNCGEYGLYLKEINSTSMISNSILTNCDAGVCVKYGPEDLIVYFSDVWNNTENYSPKSGGGVSPGDGSFSEDPMYANAATGDFTLLEGSPCIGTASDGQNMGDLRYTTTGVEDFNEALPTVISLSQNYPNPFNPTTTIAYDLPHTTHVNLTIYDILGKQVKQLINEQQVVGKYKVIWNTANDQGERVAAGLYFCRMEAEDFVDVIKLALVK